MTEAQAAVLGRVRWDAQTKLSDFDLTSGGACFHAGWLRADKHGYLSLTPAGLAALAEHERKGEKG